MQSKRPHCIAARTSGEHLTEFKSFTDWMTCLLPVITAREDELPKEGDHGGLAFHGTALDAAQEICVQ